MIHADNNNKCVGRDNNDKYECVRKKCRKMNNKFVGRDNDDKYECKKNGESIVQSNPQIESVVSKSASNHMLFAHKKPHLCKTKQPLRGQRYNFRANGSPLFDGDYDEKDEYYSQVDSTKGFDSDYDEEDKYNFQVKNIKSFDSDYDEEDEYNSQADSTKGFDSDYDTEDEYNSQVKSAESFESNYDEEDDYKSQAKSTNSFDSVRLIPLKEPVVSKIFPQKEFQLCEAKESYQRQRYNLKLQKGFKKIFSTKIMNSMSLLSLSQKNTMK